MPEKRRILLKVRSSDVPVQTFAGHCISHSTSSGSQPSLRISRLLLPLSTYIVLYSSPSSSPKSTILFLLSRYFSTLDFCTCCSLCPECSPSRGFQDLFPHLIQASPKHYFWDASLPHPHLKQQPSSSITLLTLYPALLFFRTLSPSQSLLYISLLIVCFPSRI